MTVTQCALSLRLAQEEVRVVRESLRRAVRAADIAELELGVATRRLTRLAIARPVAEPLGWRVSQGMQPTGHMPSEGR
jgi:hypothetical protein